MADNLREAVRLLGVYSGGWYDPWRLAGDAKATCRVHVMSTLAGHKVPRAKAGVNAIREAFVKALDVSGGGCAAWNDRILAEKCRALLA